MKFENLYKTIEAIKKSMGIFGKIIGGILYILLSIIVFICEIGVAGIIGIFVFLIIIDTIFGEVWDIVLIVGIVTVIGFIIWSKVKKSYQEKKSTFFKEEISKIIDNNIKKYAQQINVSTNYNLKYNYEEKTFYPNYEKKMLTLNEQEEYYKKAYERISELNEEVQNAYLNDFNSHPYIRGFYNLLNERLNFSIDTNEVYKIGSAAYSFKSFVVMMQNEAYHSLNIIQTGNEGEKRMKYALDLLKNQEDIIVLENILLTHNNKTFETDFLVFSRYGVFSLEVKNIGSSGKFTIRITPDGQWLKVFNDGNVSAMQDISSQLNYHVALTDGLFKTFEQETGITAPKVHPSIIIANNEVLLDNQANTPISRISKFASDITSKEAKYDMKEMRKLATWVEERRLKDKEYEVSDCSEDLVRIYKEIKELSRQFDTIERLFSDIQIELRSTNPEYLEKFSTEMNSKAFE